MTYTSLRFYILTGITVLVYYLLPRKVRWTALLASSALFYYLACGRDVRQILVFGASILISYLFGRLLDSRGRSRGNGEKVILAAGIVLSAAPLLVMRLGSFLPFSRSGDSGFRLIFPIGAAFYSLQMIAYLMDISRGKIRAQRNFARYALFISFFPQILQGPIPRYEQLEDQLTEGHSFRSENIVRGYVRITWGFFLKYMIADKAGVVVDTIYGASRMYLGGYVLTAGVLYSLQLYADFLACTTISQGVARLFGITLADNFAQPYYAVSVKDFWRRWHLSLSSWLRDYVYIPLGGNRKGKFRKYVNILLTFAVSGIWHGNGLNYLAWGLIHGIYQILGEWLLPLRQRVKKAFGVKKGSRIERLISRFVTFNLVMLAWILFRASSASEGIRMLLSVFTVWNPWIFWNDSLLELGLSWKEWAVLFLSVLLLWRVSRKKEQGVSLTDRLLAQPLFVRWICYIGIVLIVMVFGTYGFGYNAKDFIYIQF